MTTWLHRVVVNACLDRMRAAKIRRLEALPDDVEDRGTLVARPPSIVGVNSSRPQPTVTNRSTRHIC